MFTSWRRWLALGLSLALLTAASGCGKDETRIGPSPAPAALEETKDPDEAVDYSKYNAYVTVNDLIYDLNTLLDAYFTAVDNTPEFTLREGADYGAVREFIITDITLYYPIEQAVDWADEEPSYPDVDRAVKKLGPDMKTLMEQFNALELYMVFSEYEDDGYEKAAACHAEIYEAAQGFDKWGPRFLAAMDVLSEETSAEEMERLLNADKLIAYYSNLTIDEAQGVLDAIWEQLYTMEEGQALETEPVAAAYEKFKEDSASLLENMEDEDQIAKVGRFVEGTRYGEKGEAYIGYYTTSIKNLRYYMETLMETIGAQEDHSEALSTVSDGISNLIDRYNNYIAN